MTHDLTRFQGTECLNCGTQLTGNFCVECGQRATDVNLSVKTMLLEFIESLFSLELGFWQTFKRLVFFPGTLTVEYIVGRRKRYSSPIRLYLVTSLFFFFAVSFLGGDNVKYNGDDGQGGDITLTGKEAMAAVQENLIEKGITISGTGIDPTLDSTFNNATAKEKLRKIIQNPDSAKAKFLSTMPKAMFLMVPLAALLFKIVNFRHDRPYLHYLVFALHLHALFYLTASVSGLLGRVQPEWFGDNVAGIILLSFPINTIRAQRRAFGDSWIKAVLKAGFVWHVYGIFLGLAIAGVSLFTIWQA